jgi:hypothetical protein
VTASDRTKIAAIIGGVLGGLVLLFLVAAVLYYRRLALNLKRHQNLASELSVFRNLSCSTFWLTVLAQSRT